MYHVLWLTTGCRMLVLNCSGLSAILHIEALQRLERGSGRKLFETFEWVVATGLSALFILLMMYGTYCECVCVSFMH